jgi:hypothetical protein
MDIYIAILNLLPEPVANFLYFSIKAIGDLFGLIPPIFVAPLVVFCVAVAAVILFVRKKFNALIDEKQKILAELQRINGSK